MLNADQYWEEPSAAARSVRIRATEIGEELMRTLRDEARLENASEFSRHQCVDTW